MYTLMLLWENLCGVNILNWKFSFCDLWSWMDIFYAFFTCMKRHQHKTSNLFLPPPPPSFPDREMNIISHCMHWYYLPLWKDSLILRQSTVACFHFLLWGSNRWQPLLFDNWANKRIQYTLKICTENCCCLRLFSFAWTWVHVGESFENTFRFLGCDIFFPSSLTLFEILFSAGKGKWLTVMCHHYTRHAWYVPEDSGIFSP